MKAILPLLLVALAAGQSCNDGTASKEANRDTVELVTEPALPKPDTRCYAWRNNKDTVLLKVTLTDTSASGDLLYNFFEKDDNNGTIQGVLRKDTLLADYTFQSEGTISVRQVAFVLSDSSAVEGYGGVDEKNGRQVFKDLSKLKFQGVGLKREPCQ
ncbi:MAG: hypothetical protein P0Y53_14485 [Candidatus Pseudobacter hemicellulosilyticus]|uniref:Lipoprotein n=1 Tax=Candidatus Pseudobacter hemicellulosilyticus TaxID=3121375 RepID=A0AAJ6BG43_9BACT|nr:MAG: hypothetical protein P0Y53_14485 [Pseudobacter sp.]